VNVEDNLHQLVVGYVHMEYRCFAIIVFGGKVIMAIIMNSYIITIY